MVVRSGARTDRQVERAWASMKGFLLAHSTAVRTHLTPLLRRRLGERAGPAPAWLDYLEHQRIGLIGVLDALDTALLEYAEQPWAGGRSVAVADGRVRQALAAEAPLLGLAATALTSGDWMEFGAEWRRLLGRSRSRFYPWLLERATPTDQRIVLDCLPWSWRLRYRHLWQPRYQGAPAWWAPPITPDTRNRQGRLT